MAKVVIELYGHVDCKPTQVKMFRQGVDLELIGFFAGQQEYG